MLHKTIPHIFKYACRPRYRRARVLLCWLAMTAFGVATLWYFLQSPISSILPVAALLLSIVLLLGSTFIFIRWLTVTVFGKDLKARAQVVTALVIAVTAIAAFLTYFATLHKDKVHELEQTAKQLSDKQMRMSAAALLFDNFFNYRPFYEFDRSGFRRSVVALIYGAYKVRFSDRKQMNQVQKPPVFAPSGEDWATYEFYRSLGQVIHQISQANKALPRGSVYTIDSEESLRAAGGARKGRQQSAVECLLVVDTMRPDCDHNKAFCNGEFRRADLSFVDIHRGCFWHAQFQEADLTKAELMGGDFESASFEKATLSKVDFTPAPLLVTNQVNEVKTYRSSISFSRNHKEISDMSDLDWYELDVITFLREHHSDVRLAEKALRLFRRGELNARCTKLERANFEGADLCRAKLWGARMKGAKFLRDDHDNRANLSCAELVAADLTDADLEGAILKGAVLEGAILKGANLRDADLNCADLTNLDLSLAMGLTNKQLNDAIIDSTTTLPKGLESAKGGCEEKKRQQFCPTVID